MDAATQWMDCGIPCPVGDEARNDGAQGELAGFGIAVLVFMGVCCMLGAIAAFFVKSDATKFFVAGRKFNLFVVTATLASQSLDSNAALGNIELGYKYHCEHTRTDAHSSSRHPYTHHDTHINTFTHICDEVC